jgi:hypothetical protein
VSVFIKEILILQKNHTGGVRSGREKLKNNGSDEQDIRGDI